ncbi:hypothetical protein APHCRT_0417 [Anaplasma phagocytophilum str. CRT53-1]|uniref:Uncharacterized protein n=1 Tax=Anaplasma phagocytophilum str. CRT53-1 TaxID=1359157 RepID=A0A0F3Q7Z8_ANAPH|nr:hypothetical protein APHCRT_0417 [Anaplasma phagocytophilum str. CRT53-1]
MEHYFYETTHTSTAATLMPESSPAASATGPYPDTYKSLLSRFSLY